jgi:hypothetical protein
VGRSYVREEASILALPLGMRQGTKIDTEALPSRQGTIVMSVSTYR